MSEASPPLPSHGTTLNLSESIVKAYREAVGHSIDALDHMLYFFAFYAIVCLIVYVLIFRKWPAQWQRTKHVRFPDCKRVLVVISHPDDECMFFGPTILSLSKRTDCQVYILCLSKGLYFSIRCNGALRLI